MNALSQPQGPGQSTEGPQRMRALYRGSRNISSRLSSPCLFSSYHTILIQGDWRQLLQWLLFLSFLDSCLWHIYMASKILILKQNFFKGWTQRIWKFPGQGLNPSLGSLCQAGDGTCASTATRATTVGFLTHCTTAGTPKILILYSLSSLYYWQRKGGALEKNSIWMD